MLSMLTRTLFASGYGGQIHTLSFNPSSSPALSVSSSVSAGSAPTWLTLHPTLPLLYTGDEFSSPQGVLSTFAIDPNASSLAPVGQPGQSKEGPVHFVLNPNKKELYSAAYSAGALSTAKLLDDGTFDQERKGQNFVYAGKGQNAERQEGPHAHGVAIDPTGGFLFCTDLGTDQLHVYKISEDRLHLATSVATTRGSGPRHLVFSQTSPSRSLLYLVEELSNTVSIYEVLYPDTTAPPAPEAPSTPPPPPVVPKVEESDSAAPLPPAAAPRPDPHPPVVAVPTPTINPLQLSVSILPPNSTELAAGDWTAAELSLSSDRKLLYVTNRAPIEPSLPKTDYLTIFTLEDEGKIVEGETSYVELGGVGPRHFMLSPKSDEGVEYMAVAFQRTNEVVVYEVNGKDIKEVARVDGIEGATCVVWK